MLSPCVASRRSKCICTLNKSEEDLYHYVADIVEKGDRKSLSSIVNKNCIVCWKVVSATGKKRKWETVKDQSGTRKQWGVAWELLGGGGGWGLS